MKTVTIIIPCKNEAEAVPLFHEKLYEIRSQLQNKFQFEEIYIDDGSTDQTLQELRDLSAEDRGVTYISFSRNFGKEAAMYAGFCNAKGDYVCVMDADLQDPPELLPEMLDILEAEGSPYDSVATRRVTRKGEPRIRSFFARKFYKIMNRISDADVVDGARDFRLMKREMVDAIIRMGEHNRFSKGIFGWIGFKTKWIEFENRERIAGETKWNFWGLLRYAIDGIVNFSEVPLSIASWMGFIFTGISFLAVIFIVVRRLIFGDPVAGWASTVCIITFIGGIQLFCTGITGKYLSKIYVEVKNRPHYIISETNRRDAEKIG